MRQLLSTDDPAVAYALCDAVASADAGAGATTGSMAAVDRLQINCQILARAVRLKELVRFVYRRYSRIAEPYRLGFDGDGSPALIAWQVSGGCEEGKPIGWKTFLMVEIVGIQALPERFTVRPVDPAVIDRSNHVSVAGS